MVRPIGEHRRRIERQCKRMWNIRRGIPTRRQRCLSSVKPSISRMLLIVIHTIRPPMRFENEEDSIESYPDEGCAQSQTDWKRHVDPVSLGRRINEIRDDPRWRLQARPTEHRLCHRCRVILGHNEVMDAIAALLF